MKLNKKQLIVGEYYDTIKRSKKYKTCESLKYTHSMLSQISLNNMTECSIEVWNIDTFTAALTLNDNNIVILNMASEIRPGGGVEKGAYAQEESLFVRSTYCSTLTKDLYPLTSDELIYSPTVTIIKDEKWKLLSKPMDLSIIACAAIRNPKLIKGEYTESDKILMTNKIKAIFELAIFYKHRTIILGAFGCGAFNNPPKLVGLIFKDLIEKYKTNFNRIIFAILGDENYIIFKQIFT